MATSLYTNMFPVKQEKRTKRFSEETIKEIRESNLSHRTLGRRYGVSHTFIRMIKHGKAYK